MKICLIVGTRPQIIKSQPIVREILSSSVKLSIIHTGQHYDHEMSKTFFKELKIRNPDYNLEIGNYSSYKQLGEIITKLEKPLRKIKPALVLVPGDTRSALATALSANRLKIPLAHIESGARSFDINMEEEINRRLIDHCSNLLFAPTENCYKNLENEKVMGNIYFCGDTMYDVYLEYKKMLKLKTTHDGNYILMTIHRQENIQNYNQLKKILGLAKKISKSGYKVIFPIHPHTRKQVRLNKLSLTGLQIISPVGYSKMLQLLSKAKMLLTDSGGLQKEAYWTNTPCVTLRKNTEWKETLAGNHNILLPTIKNSDIQKIILILNSKSRKKSKGTKLFGNGKSAKKIVSILLNQF